MNIGIGNNSDIRFRTPHDQAQIAMFGCSENFEYTQNTPIGILGNSPDVRTARDMQAIREFGCGMVNEGYKRVTREGYAAPRALDGSACNCSCKAGCACPFSRITSTPYNPMADYVQYAPMQ